MKIEDSLQLNQNENQWEENGLKVLNVPECLANYTL
jgi:hypothetical protein